MSNYRDDTQETAVASSKTWLGLSAVSEGVARASATVLFGLMVVHADEAVASDGVIDRANHVVVESAAVSEQWTGALSAGVTVSDGVRVSDRYRHTTRVLHESGATVSDGFQELLGSIVTELARASDEIEAQRSVISVVAETARVSDATIQLVSDLMEVGAAAESDVFDRLRSRDLVTEEAATAVVILDGHKALPPLIIETARASSEVFGHLHAADAITEMAVIEDLVVGDELGGQAWTANVDSWAMSRYQPYGFSRIAVIDGVAYGETENGVYALNGGEGDIEGLLVTGKVDLSQGQLTHPTAAYLEYELDGRAELDVTTTQTGTPATYTYVLPEEQARHMTNGRFVFGRGLRGRHFSFALRLTGEHGHINDFSVQTAQTRRRV